MSSELKPCPFCGGFGGLRLQKYKFLTETHWIRCQLCGTESAPKATEEDAIKAWNTRTNEEDK